MCHDSEWGFFDLQFDPTNYLTADETKLRVALETKAIRRIPINSQPGLLPVEFAPADVGGGRLSLETYQTRAKSVREDAAFRERVGRMLAAIHQEKYGGQSPSPYIEARIHEGFPTPGDAKRMDAFHGGSRSERAKIADSFEDERYRDLGMRVIAGGQPEALNDDRRRQWSIWRHERLFETADVPWPTVPKALDEIISLEPTATPVQRTLLADLRSYLTALSR